MGTTLTNGIYLPNEGEKNCYAGLKTNWETLDQKIADITALQQAVAGALHREIVESLPTTDIDPNTIYMVLSGTSATENVYNEFMYVNNAWELIGTSATDLTNYYTKGDVDGLLLLKANASDLTSHTGDTTIHVTTNDKSKWNTVALIKQLRLVNAQVGSATTIAFANIDDTNGIKVGDKCMDLDAKMFEITAVDTTNQTVTVGSALIDIALDGDVVHKSGNETISGFKEFANIRATNSIKGINLENTTTDLNNCYSDFASSDGSRAGNIQYYYCNTDSGTANISNLPEAKAFVLTSITTRLLSNSLYVKQILINSNSKTFVRYCSNSTWSSWVNETDSEYVHKSGNETVDGNKTFSKYITSDGSSTGDEYSNNARTNLWLMGNRDTEEVSGVIFDTYRQNIAQGTGIHILGLGIKENSLRYEGCRWGWYWDNNLNGYSFDFKPTTQGANQALKHNLGTSTDKWDTLNGINPGALSLPDLNSGIDISGYLTVGTTSNTYTALADGYVSILTTASSNSAIYWSDSNGIIGDTAFSAVDLAGTNRVTNITFPVNKGVTYVIVFKTVTNIESAKFFPCQGNV